MKETKNMIITITYYNPVSHNCKGQSAKGNFYIIDPFVGDCVPDGNGENRLLMGRSLVGKTFLIEEPYYCFDGTLAPSQYDFKEITR